MDTLNTIIKHAKQLVMHEAATVLQLVEHIQDSFVQVVELILHSKGRVVITGVGKSAIIAQKIVATLNSTGTPALFMHAAEAIHGDLGMIQKDDIVICISKSGNTPEIKVLVPLLKKGKNTLISIVSDKKSYLAEKSDFILYAHVEREACPFNLAPTSSTTAQLVLGDALAMCLLHERKFSSKDFAKYHPGGSLGKRMYLRVEDVCIIQKAPSVLPNQSIKEVIMEISSKRMGAAAVVTENNDLIGIITDGDLRRMLERLDEFHNLTAHDIMTPTPKTIQPQEMAVAAVELMEQNSITQLPVVHESKYVGMIHIHDLLKEGIM